jgi:hypothetical protein
MFPATGSTMTEATSEPCDRMKDEKASRSLYGSTAVVEAMASGTPMESGCPA